MLIDDPIEKNIIRLFRINLDVKQDESCLILSDLPNDMDIIYKTHNELDSMFKRILLARRFYDVCRSRITPSVNLKIFTGSGVNGAEPPNSIADEMLNYDVIIILTTYSLTHTNAREKATQKGARIASMPGFTEKMLSPNGPMDVDYNAISKSVREISALGSKVKIVEVTSEIADYHFQFEKTGRPFLVDDGLYTTPKSFGNLPAGESYCAPLEGTSNGSFIVKAGWYPNLKEDLKINVEDGLVVSINGGGAVGEYLVELLGLGEGFDPDEEPYRSRRNIAEFGIGANPNASDPVNVLEAEKIKGTIHIAIGDNSHFGGKVKSDIHIDFVLPNVNVKFDGEYFSELLPVIAGGFLLQR